MKRRSFLFATLVLALFCALGLLFVSGRARAQEGSPERALNPEEAAAAVGTGFGFQGVLAESGVPVNGACDFTFSLWDDAVAGTQIGSTQVVSGDVTDGRFDVIVNGGGEFGTNAFTGEARWLAAAVDCGGGATPLDPRRLLSAIPYAQSLRPGAVISGGIPSNDGYGAALTLLNNGVAGRGLRVEAVGAGVRVTSAHTGVSVDSALYDGVFVNAAGDDGLSVCHTGAETNCTPQTTEHNGVEIGSTEHHGVRIDDAGWDGVLVDAAGQEGVQINAADRYGLFVGTSGAAGVYVGTAGDDGVYVGSAVQEGVQVQAAGDIGVFVGSAGTDGFHVNSAGDDGVEVGTAADRGVEISSAGSDGLAVTFAGDTGLGFCLPSADNNGVEICAAEDQGVQVGSAGGDGLFVCRTGAETACVPRPSNNGVEIGSTEHHGVRIDDAGSDGVHVGSATFDGLRVDAAGDDGVDVVSAADDGLVVREALDDGIHIWAATVDGVEIDSAGDNGIQVDAAGGHGVSAFTTNNARFGGYFVNAGSTAADGSGLYARGNQNTAPDIVLGGTSIANDDGIIRSEPAFAGSDIFLRSNDAVVVDLDYDGDGEDADFLVRDKDGTEIFNVDNDGFTTVQVLELTGGADLSEQFDVRPAAESLSPEPGQVVCIDAQHPGRLVVCDRAYDRTVAGVLSGAGGIQTGMLMGQVGSEADGRYPVALTGRVYVWADATTAPIEPGDLLTTASVPGYAASVTDYARAQGAILGKAMTALETGQGLVLVLVSLQ